MNVFLRLFDFGNEPNVRTFCGLCFYRYGPQHLVLRVVACVRVCAQVCLAMWTEIECERDYGGA
jgi:hypothetical protein